AQRRSSGLDAGAGHRAGQGLLQWHPGAHDHERGRRVGRGRRQRPHDRPERTRALRSRGRRRPRRHLPAPGQPGGDRRGPEEPGRRSPGRHLRTPLGPRSDLQGLRRQRHTTLRAAGEL
ncbi:hypothetical protein AVDCRST_MAG82-1673, partial [uncultured Rubrobacteraceae bacterium]